jgi:DNA polymerase delta subunit 1
VRLLFPVFRYCRICSPPFRHEVSASTITLTSHQLSTSPSLPQLYLAMPSLIAGVKRMIDDGVQISGLGVMRGQTYESNVPFVLRYMIDNDISGADWVVLPGSTYTVLPQTAQKSRCNIEVDVFYTNVQNRECVAEWSALAPMRILSFDIECQGRKGHFPDAQFDPVIQIANTVTIQGSDQPIIRNVFTLNTCLPIVGAQVKSTALSVLC